MVRFVIPGLFVYSNDIGAALPPRLEEPMLDWLESSGITDWSLCWVKREQRLESYLVMWDTVIEFQRDSDAVLFKLVWG